MAFEMIRGMTVVTMRDCMSSSARCSCPWHMTSMLVRGTAGRAPSPVVFVGVPVPP